MSFDRLVGLVCFWIGLAGLLPTPVYAGDTELRSTVQSLRQSPMIRFSLSTKLHTKPPLIHFLMDNLDISSAIIRALELDRLHADRISPDRYQARDHAGLRGTIVELHRSDTRAVFFGRGTYETTTLSYEIHGKTLATITLESRSDTTLARVDLAVRSSNWFVRTTSFLFRPFLLDLAESKSKNLANLARVTVNKLQHEPERVLISVWNLDDKKSRDYTRKLENFLFPEQQIMYREEFR